jgi:hypothetical protein
MADFKTRIDDLTGFGSTDDVAVVDWLTAGAREIIDILPMSKLDRMSEVQDFTGNQGVEDSKILHVLRKDENNSNVLMPCREIHASQSGRAADSSYMEFATSSDPVYYLENKRVYTLPASAASDDSKLVKINEDFTIAATDTTIDNFPKEATNAVVLYAARNALIRLMNAIHSNSNISTAFTALKAELDETQTVCDSINTQINDAVTEIAEMVSNVDVNVDTALDAIKTSADKMNAAVGLAHDEFDKAEGESVQAEAESDDAAVATALAEIHTQVDSAVALISTDSGNNAIVNKVVLAASNISNAATEMGLAKAEAAEIATQTDSASGSSKFNLALDAINTAVDKFRADADDPALFGDESVYLTGDGLTKVKDALDNAQKIIDDGGSSPTGSASADAGSYLGTEEDTELLNGALSIASTEQNRARIHIEEFASSVNALQSEINGFATEVNARATFTGAKGQAVQAYISTAQGYINEAQSNLALANGYNTAVGAYLTAAQGYASEIQAYVTTSQMFIGTASNRINVGNAYLAEANARASEVNTYASEVNSRLSQVNAQGGVANVYLSAAQGYAGEIASKINISQGYSNEINLRLSVDTTEYSWYQSQYQMVDAQFKEALQLISVEKIEQEEQRVGR